MPRAWWLLPLALVYLWPVVLEPGGVLMPAHSAYTDLLVSHWPNALWIRRALFVYHEPPLWNPAILGGQPFAADPLAGVWYPPAWLLWIPFLPLGLAFNLLFAAHLAWGGWGMLRFLLDPESATGPTAWPAFLGAAAFMGLPKWTAHLAAGHVSLCFAVAWTPWLLSAVRQAARTARPREAAVAAAVFALLFLADVRWAAYAGLLALAYWLAIGWEMRSRGFRRAILNLGLFAAAFLALAAVLWLPLAEFIRLTARSSLGLAETAAYSLPPNYLLGLLLPDLGGFHEWQTYLGLLPLALAVLGSVWRDSPQRVFWLIAFAAAVLFSLGSNTPIYALAVRLIPPLGLLRVPPRAWFVAGTAVCVLAAHGAAGLASASRPRLGRRFRQAAFGLAGLAWGLAAGAWVVLGRPLPALVLLAASASIGPGLLALLSANRLNPAQFLPLACVAVIVDLALVNSSLMRAVPESQAFEPGATAAGYLADRAEGYRVYSPSYSLPQHVAARSGLELADGVNPLQLAAAVDFMSRATGIPATGYSVTLPPFANGDPALANAGALPNAPLLGLMGVRYLAAEFDFPSAALVELARFGRTRLYENPYARPRAWVEFSALAAPDRGTALRMLGQGAPVVEAPAGLTGSGDWLPAAIVRRGLNFLIVEAVTDQAGLLVLAEVYYPGWRVWVDGQPGEIVRVDGLLRGVFLPAGRHTVHFQFVPETVIIGLTVSAVAWLVGGAAWLAAPRARRGRP